MPSCPALRSAASFFASAQQKARKLRLGITLGAGAARRDLSTAHRAATTGQQAGVGQASSYADILCLDKIAVDHAGASFNGRDIFLKVVSLRPVLRMPSM